MREVIIDAFIRWEVEQQIEFFREADAINKRIFR